MGTKRKQTGRDFLRQYMEQNNLSLRDVSQKTGGRVSIGTLSLILAGKARITDRSAKALAAPMRRQWNRLVTDN